MSTGSVFDLYSALELFKSTFFFVKLEYHIVLDLDHVDAPSTGSLSDPCETDCGAVVLAVCGSNGFTYQNECQLKATACRQGVNIKVKHEGECKHEDQEAQGEPTL
jgi:hypothetical protein